MVYHQEFGESEFDISCTCPEIANLCVDVETIVFSELLDIQLSIYHNNIINSERWIAEHIRREDVLPMVYDIISRSQ